MTGKNFKTKLLKVIALAFFSLGSVTSNAIVQPSSEAFTTVKRFDLAGRVTGVIKPSPDGTSRYPAIRTTYYQSSDLIKRVETGYLSNWKNETIAPKDWNNSHFFISHVSEYTYDGQGRKIVEKVKNGSSGATLSRTEFNYDEFGRVQCKAVRMNDGRFDLAYSESSVCVPGPEANYGPDRITRYEYGLYDSVTEEHRAVGTDLEQLHVKYAYAGRGRLLAEVTDANGNLSKRSYDNYGRLKKWEFPSKTNIGSVNSLDFEEYTYDNNGNRKTLRKRDGRVITYYYDALDRVIKKDLPNTTKDVYYGYNLKGNQLYARYHSHSHSDGVTRTYSGYGEIKSEKNRLGGNDYTTTFDFDKNSLRTFVNHYDGKSFKYDYDGIDGLNKISRVTETTPIITVTYDGHARPWKSTTGGNAVTTLNYDGVSRVESIDLNMSGSSGDVDYDFRFNPADQITSLDTSNNSYVFTGTGSQQGSYSVNGLNQYENISGQTVNHDANGNLTQLGSSNYVYDVENRLISAPGATLNYDPLGRLVEYNVSNSDPVYFLHDGDNVIAEIKNGSIFRRYVHSSNMGTPVVQYFGSTVREEDRQYLHKNHQGSVIGASGSNGSFAYANTYDPFGVPGANNEGRFSFTGQMYLAEIGLHHYRARVYNASIGRFMQTDPIGYEDQINLYAYVHNDPLAHNDPTGENTGHVIRGVFLCMSVPACRKAVIKKIKEETKKRAEQKAKKKAENKKRTRSEKVKRERWKQNEQANNGKNKCDRCGKEVEKGKKLEKGDKVPENRGDVHHKEELGKGGKDKVENTELLCNPCHKIEHGSGGS